MNQKLDKEFTSLDESDIVVDMMGSDTTEENMWEIHYSVDGQKLWARVPALRASQARGKVHALHPDRYVLFLELIKLS